MFGGKSSSACLRSPSCFLPVREEMTMDHKLKKTRMGGVFFLAVCVGFNATAQSVPPGAAVLGYTNCVINDNPTAAEIASGETGNYNWFCGSFVAAQFSPTNCSTVNGALSLNFTGTSLNVASVAKDLSASALPLFAGSNGFYAEFDVQLSDNNSDHWPAVWLMPTEHDHIVGWPGALTNPPIDIYPPDPTNFERWMEFDVDEGGWGSGLAGTVHNWTGISPDYGNVQNPNNVDPTTLDRSQKHTFGGSYDPINGIVAWWVDGVYQMSASTPYVPAIAARQHFYLILSAQSHGSNLPYSMYVSGVRVYVPVRPAPPTNLHVSSP